MHEVRGDHPSDEYRRTLKTVNMAARVTWLGIEVLQRQLDEGVDPELDGEEVLANLRAAVERLRDGVYELTELSGVALGRDGRIVQLNGYRSRAQS